MEKKKVIVTGGNGYIGSHMCKLLHLEGHDVHIVDNFQTSPSHPVHQYGTFHHMDISDSVKIEELFKHLKPHAIFHFAALAQVAESQAEPLKYYEENVVKTISLLTSAIRSSVPNFIFSSTCATFGIPTTTKLSETSPQNPINTYGLTKKIMELVMRDLAEKKLINVIVFRYFNAAGSSPQSEIGENHDPETHLIPSLVLAHLEGKEGTFSLYGDKFETPDGTCIRDYIHVDDLAEIHLKGLKYLESHSGFFDFNLGSGEGHSNLEVLTTFEKITQKKLNVVIQPPRAGDPPMLVGDSSKAARELHFKTKYNLEDSIKHTLHYLSNRRGHNS